MKKIFYILISLALIIMLKQPTAAYACMGGMDHEGSHDEHGKSGKAVEKSDTHALLLIEPYLNLEKAIAAGDAETALEQASAFNSVIETALEKAPKSQESDSIIPKKLSKTVTPFLKKSFSIAKHISPCAGMAEKVVNRFLGDGKVDQEKIVMNELHDSTKALTDRNSDISALRKNFGALSDIFSKYAGMYLSSEDLKGFQVYYCEMEKHYWIQKTGESMKNPFYGDRMPDCGKKSDLSLSSHKIDSDEKMMDMP